MTTEQLGTGHTAGVSDIFSTVGSYLPDVTNMWWLIFLLLVVFLWWPLLKWVLLITGLFRINWKWKQDPRRLFTANQKKVHYRSINNRCEWRVAGTVRCKHTGTLQADHWIPWSYGGATNNKNLVGLCPDHNRKKSDKHPPVWMTFSIGFFRIGYMGKLLIPGRSYKVLRGKR